MEDSRQRLSSHTWACHLLDVTSNKLFNFLSFSFLICKIRLIMKVSTSEGYYENKMKFDTFHIPGREIIHVLVVEVVLVEDYYHHHHI